MDIKLPNGQVKNGQRNGDKLPYAILKWSLGIIATIFIGAASVSSARVYSHESRISSAETKVDDIVERINTLERNITKKQDKLEAKQDKMNDKIDKVLLLVRNQND